jgi:hypothetical protein
MASTTSGAFVFIGLAYPFRFMISKSVAYVTVSVLNV